MIIDTCAHRNRHEHGTTTGYRVCGCRCADCRRAHADYKRGGRPPRVQGSRTCEVEGCERAHWALGMCHVHYRRVRRTGTPAGQKGSSLALVEDVEFMFETGESLPRIATRAGYDNCRSLARQLGRSGRRDLAALFYREA